MDHAKLSPAEIIDLFAFLDSETPAAQNWMGNYLTNKGILIPMKIYGTQNLKLQLANIFLSTKKSSSDIKLFARKMGNAWRVKNHRQNKNIVSLSVSLDRSVTTQLSKMSKGKKKSEVVTQLIENNYHEFLLSNERLKTKKIEAKGIRKIEERNLESHALLNRVTSSTSAELSQLLASQKQKNEDLREGIAKLYDLIFSANDQGLTIDDQTLVQATKIYYSHIERES